MSDRAVAVFKGVRCKGAMVVLDSGLSNGAVVASSDNGSYAGADATIASDNGLSKGAVVVSKGAKSKGAVVASDSGLFVGNGAMVSRGDMSVGVLSGVMFPSITRVS